MQLTYFHHMKAELVSFGVLEINGEQYRHDVVIDKGKIEKRDKTASRKRKQKFAHTPLTAEENIPWDCKTLLIGTGAYGRLPITNDVQTEADIRSVTLVIDLTKEICRKLAVDPPDTNVILHSTC